jgi:hypothetical protein
MGKSRNVPFVEITEHGQMEDFSEGCSIMEVAILDGMSTPD